MRNSRFVGVILAAGLLSGCGVDLQSLVKSQLGGSSSSSSSSTSGSSSASASASASINLPNPLEIATATGLKGSSCSEEGTIKSSNGAATKVAFKNNSQGKINIYWLDQNGKRKEYKIGLAAGATHNQSTFVTHPWLITNDQDQCMGIWTPTEAGDVTLDVKKTVTVSGGSSASTSTTAGGDASTAALESRIACLKAKGDNARAGAVQASINLYLAANKAGGLAVISAQAYLKQAQDIAAQGGC